MLRKESEAVLEVNDPIPQQEEFGSGQPTLEDAFQEIREEWKEKMDKIRRYVMQQLESQEQDARQPRLAYGGGRASKQEDSRAHGGRRLCSSSDAWG